MSSRSTPSGPPPVAEGSGVLRLLESIDEEDRTRIDQAPAAPIPIGPAAPTIDFSDTTHPHAAVAPPPTESELIIDVDASGEAPAIDDEMLIADEADMVDGDEAAEPAAAEPQAPPPGGKRSVPPPLPRGG